MTADKEPPIDLASTGPLTDREAECLLWVARGKTSWEAGRIMGITEQTANAHILAAGRKLDACNRVHLVAKAFVVGILRAGSVLILVLAIALRIPGVGKDSSMRRVSRGRTRRYPVTQMVGGLRNNSQGFTIPERLRGRSVADHQIHNLDHAGSIPAPVTISRPRDSDEFIYRVVAAFDQWFFVDDDRFCNGSCQRESPEV